MWRGICNFAVRKENKGMRLQSKEIQTIIQIDVYKRQRLLRSSQENNPVVVNLDASLRAMRSNVLTTSCV